MKAIKTAKRVLAFILTAALVWGVVTVKWVPAAPNYNTVEGLGGFDHYNGIVFDTFEAVQADTEGAIAVGGVASLGTGSSGQFDVGAGAKGNYILIGERYNQGQYKDFPGLLLGAKPELGKNVQVIGSDIVVPASVGTSLNFKDSTIVSTSDVVVKSWFTNVYIETMHAMEMLAAKLPTSTHIYAADFIGWGGKHNTTFSSTNIKRFEETLTFTSGGKQKILLINVVDKGSVVINGPQVTNEFGKYDMVIINFPNVSDAQFTGAELLVGGKQCNPTTPASYNNDAAKLMKEYATKMVWTFPNADTVRVDSTGVIGSLIAPHAKVRGDGGSINGMLVADKFHTQNGCELHSFRLKRPFFDIDPGVPAVTGDVELYKYDASDKHDMPLAGAKFKLYKVDDNGTERYLDEYTTNAYGLLYESNLEEGTYYFVESKPPEGYQASDEKYYFSIGPGSGTDGIPVRLLVKNDPVTYEFTKVDENGDPIRNNPATFQLFRVLQDVNNDLYLKYIHTYPTASDGKFSIRDLEPGIYRIMEIIPPDGYEVVYDYYELNTYTAALGYVLTGYTYDSSTQNYVADTPNEQRISPPGPYTYKLKNKKQTDPDPNDPEPDMNIVIQKVDRETKEVLPDAKFKAFYAKDYPYSDPNSPPTAADPPSGSNWSWEAVEDSVTNTTEFITGDNGQITIQAKLKPGWYKFVEIEPPTGYKLWQDGVYIFRFIELVGGAPLVTPGSIVLPTTFDPIENEADTAQDDTEAAPGEEPETPDSDDADGQLPEDAFAAPLGDAAGESEGAPSPPLPGEDDEEDSQGAVPATEQDSYHRVALSVGLDRFNAGLEKDANQEPQDEKAPPVVVASNPVGGDAPENTPPNTLEIISMSEPENTPGNSPPQEAGDGTPDAPQTPQPEDPDDTGTPEAKPDAQDQGDDAEEPTANSPAVAPAGAPVVLGAGGNLRLGEGYEIYKNQNYLFITLYNDLSEEQDDELGQIIVKKVDENGLDDKELPTKTEFDTIPGVEGAQFTLYYRDDGASGSSQQWVPVRVGETGGDGRLEFLNLVPGDYMVKETRAPEGFEKLIYPESAPLVNINGTPEYVVTVEPGHSTPQISYLVKGNPRTKVGALELYKRDGDTDAALDGVSFTLQKENDDGSWATVSTHTATGDGRIRINNLEQGYYRLTEIKAPAGYEVQRDFNKNTLYFTISDRSIEYNGALYGGSPFRVFNYKKSSKSGGGGGGISLVPIYPDFFPLSNLILTDPEIEPPYEYIPPPAPETDNPSMGDLRERILYGIIALAFGVLLLISCVRQWQRWKYLRMK